MRERGGGRGRAYCGGERGERGMVLVDGEKVVEEGREEL